MYVVQIHFHRMKDVYQMEADFDYLHTSVYASRLDANVCLRPHDFISVGSMTNIIKYRLMVKKADAAETNESSMVC